MASFKICLRKANATGFWPVYIRVTNCRRVGYIKTSWVVDKRGITKNGDVKDPYVVENCTRKINEYIKRLNGVDTSTWSFDSLRNFLTGGEGGITFSAYAQKFISRLEKLGHDGNARLYKASVASLQRFMGTEAVMFSSITKEKIEAWIAELGGTRRAKSSYPICIRVIFKDAMAASMDPASTLPQLTYDPWSAVSIPESQPSGKRSISVEDCRRFFAVGIPDEKGAWPERLGRDMALLSFCLAGMNTVDIFNLAKSDFDGKVISYKRTKTRTRRKDGAYFEIEVNEMAASILAKYKADDSDPHLLNFNKRYNNARSFNAMVNAGIRKICLKHLKLKEEQLYSFYSFRHTWATIAQNICGANLSEIGFAMNHLQDHAVTRDYIDIDFSPAWELNQKVYDAVFGVPQTKSKASRKNNNKQAEDIVKPECMIYARLYFRGEVKAEISDIGFASAEDVVSRFSERMPDMEIPDGTAVQIRIKNVDTAKEIVIERIKGKDI